jgi:hypothetical protein
MKTWAEVLALHKKAIGFKLTFLRHAKQFPDNYTPTHVEQIKKGLSLDLFWKAKIYRDHPELRPTRVKQMSLLKRFKPTVSEWLKYAEDHGVHNAIITYINKAPADLMLESKNITPGEISPSPRSWVSLSDCLLYMAKQGQNPLKNENYLSRLCKGYLGNTVTANFVDYVKKNYENKELK